MIKKIIRKISQVLLWLVLVVLGIYTLILVMVHLPPVQRYILNIAEKEGSRAITGSISIKSFYTNLLSFVDFSSIRINSPGVPQDSIHINKAQVIYSLFPLFQKKVVISSIKLSGGAVFAIREEGGKFKIPGIPRKTQKNAHKKDEWQVEIRTVCVNNIDLKYYDAALNSIVTLRKLDGCTEVDSLEGFLSSEKVQIRSPWYDETFDLFKINFKYRDSLIQISPFLMEGKDSYIMVAGNVPVSADKKFNLTGELLLDASSVTRKIIESKHSISGVAKTGINFTGTINKPLFDVTITSSSLAYNEIISDTLHFKANYNENESLLIKMLVKKAGFAEAVINSSFDINNIFTKPEIKGYTSNIDITGIEIDPVMKKFSPYQLNIYGIGSIHAYANSSNLKELPQNGTIDVAISENGSAAIDTLWARVNLHDNTWLINSLLGKGNYVSGKGIVELNKKLQGKISGTIKRPNLIGGFFLTHPVKGSLDVKAEFSNIFRSPLFNLDLKSDSLSWRGFHISNFSGQISYKNHQFNVDNLITDISASLDKVQIPDIKDIHGQLLAKVNASGSFTQPFVQSRVQINNPAYQGLTAEQISASLLYQKNQVAWDSLLIKKDTLSLESSGLLNIQKKNIDFQLNTDLLVKGVSAIMLRTSGSYTKDSFAVISALDYARAGLLYSKIPVTPCVEGIMRINGRIDKNRCLKNGSFQFNFLQTGLFLSNPYRYIGSLTYSPREINGNARVIEKTDSISMLNILIQAPIENGCFSNGVQLSEKSVIQCEAKDFEFGQILQSLKPELFSDGKLNGKARAVKKKGLWNLDGTISVTADTLSYIPLNITASKVATDISLSGSIQNPVIGLIVSSRTIGFNEISSVNLNAHSTYYGSYITIDTLYSNFTNGGRLQVNGSIPLSVSAGRSINIAYILDSIPLIITDHLLPTINISGGVLSGRGHVGYESSSINSIGDIRVNDLEFTIENCDTKAGPLQMLISLEDNRAIIDTLYGKWDDGNIFCNGYVQGGFGGLEDLGVDLKVKDIEINCFEAFQVALKDAVATLQKEKSQYLLFTDITLDPSRIEQIITLTSLLEDFMEGKRTPVPKSSLFQKTNIQAQIDLNSNLTIDTNLGRFLIDGKVEIAGNLAHPRYNAVLRIDEGQVRYLDQNFEIEEGTIRQFSSPKIDPTVDLAATSNFDDVIGSRIQEYAVTVKVKGRLRDPEITLTSNPPLEEKRIISLITTGGTEGGPGLQARSGQVLSSYVTGIGSQYIEQITGLRNVNLSGNLFSSDGGLSVSVSQDLTSRISVSYKTDITDFGKYAVEVMYRVIPQLRLLGSTDSKGNSDIGLRFIYRR